MILETQRLKLRPFQPSDLESFLAYRSDPEVARYQGWEMPYTVEKAEAFIKEMMQSTPGTDGRWYQFAVALKETGAMIGDCAFHTLAHDKRQAEIGFSFARSHQGFGYASEAVNRLLRYLFEDLALHRVTAVCDVKNIASARLLKRVGMRREAHFIDNIWFKGNWCSEYLYAILQDEWLTFN
ncbi:MAG: GNAT family N-acetyltransferase [Anaerolineae bacterium]|nr:GNAT family N-acetyltransferase [Anaerolineae bacterium]